MHPGLYRPLTVKPVNSQQHLHSVMTSSQSAQQRTRKEEDSFRSPDVQIGSASILYSMLTLLTTCPTVNSLSWHQIENSSTDTYFKDHSPGSCCRSGLFWPPTYKPIVGSIFMCLWLPASQRSRGHISQQKRTAFVWCDQILLTDCWLQPRGAWDKRSTKRFPWRNEVRHYLWEAGHPISHNELI